MKKAGRILVLLTGMGIILGIAIRAEAEEIGSRGVMRFQGVGESVQAWSQDVAVLRDRTGMVSEEAFDPAHYSAYPVTQMQ